MALGLAVEVEVSAQTTQPQPGVEGDGIGVADLDQVQVGLVAGLGAINFKLEVEDPGRVTRSSRLTTCLANISLGVERVSFLVFMFFTEL